MRKKLVVKCMKFCIISSLFVVVACSPARQMILEKMKTFEDDPSNIPTRRIEELKRDIDANYKEFMRTIKAAENLGVYYRMLAAEYLDREMYTLSYEAAIEAIYYFPANYKLHYYAAVCAAYSGKAEADAAKKQQWFSFSKTYYEQSLQFRPSSVDSLLGLAVLHVYELKSFQEAMPYLSRLLEINPNHVEGLFVLAQVYIHQGRYDLALETYEHLISFAPSDEVRKQAIQNSQLIRGRDE